VARRRSIEVFTLSFLDCMLAVWPVILFYTIVSAQSA